MNSLSHRTATFACALLAGLAASAHAQNPQPPAAASASAAQQPAQKQQTISVADEVTVTAEGETRDVQSVDQKLLLESTPGTSPIAALAHLPSVEVTSADPYGAYEWALRISVRGFNQNQLGFTLDDVPLGDMSYGNLNGLHISRALIDENLQTAVLSQGTASLGTASTSNLGGAIQFLSTVPSDKEGFIATQSFGSFSGSRTFARFDSGLLHTHTKIFVDGVYQSSDKWRGLGPLRQSYYQFNAKLQQFVGSKGVFTAYADFSNRQEVDYQDENKLWVKSFGYHTDNFGDWGVALQAANAYNAQGGGGPVFAGISTAFPLNIPSIQSGFGDLSNDPEDVGYYAAGGLRKDFLGYLKYDYALTPHLTSKTTVYGHHNAGTGLWFTPYLATYDPSGTPISPISERTSEYRIARGGILSTLNYVAGRNTVEGGIWYEQESFDLARRFYGTTLQGPQYSIYDTPKNPFFTQWAYNFPTKLFQIHLQDELKLTSKLLLQAGFKTSETYTTGTLTGYDEGLSFLNPTDKPANYAQGKLTSGKPFLPQVGLNWKLATGSEIFADVAENTRAFQAGGKGFGTSPWGTTQAGFNALTNNLKAESSWSEEAGFRHTTNHLQAQASYFHVDFSNRLLAIQQGPGIAGDASLLSNVGGVTTNGVDGAITYRLNNGWSLYNAATFSKSTYNSNYTSGTTVYDTGGKVVIDSPEFLYKNELSYSKHGFDAHIGSDYLGKRYFTYTDDNSVGGRWIADFGTSYHVDEVGPISQLKLQLNLYNLFNNKYWGTIGTNGFVASDPTSIANNTLQPGAPFAITGTFSARF